MTKWYWFIYISAIYVQAVLGGESDIDKRILGGTNVTDGSIPWQASLRNKQKNFHFCGGAIVGKKWILTAANCVASRQAEDITVVVGTNKLSAGGDFFDVEKITIHENFNAKTRVNDIAVLKLKKELKYTNKIKSIEVDKKVIEGLARGLVSGWGYTDNNKTRPDNLKQLVVGMISRKQCEDKLRTIPKALGFKYTNGNICSINRKDVGLCDGDIGGPLTRESKLAGIVSYVVPCGRGFPDVYTRLSSFYNWIIKNTKE